MKKARLSVRELQQEDIGSILTYWYNAPDFLRGMGVEFVRLSINYFFNNYKLQKLYCEPYAFNPAPNKTLAKAGFRFVKNYRTTPGWLNFEQEVCLWEMSREPSSRHPG